MNTISSIALSTAGEDSMATGLAKGDADALDVMKQEETWAARNQKRGSRTRETLAQFVDTMVLSEARKRPAQGRSRVGLQARPARRTDAVRHSSRIERDVHQHSRGPVLDGAPRAHGSNRDRLAAEGCASDERSVGHRALALAGIDESVEERPGGKSCASSIPARPYRPHSRIA
jgi:hypothetical protein